MPNLQTICRLKLAFQNVDKHRRGVVNARHQTPQYNQLQTPLEKHEIVNANLKQRIRMPTYTIQ